MTEGVLGKVGRLALWFSPVVIVAAGFFLTLTWIKPNPVIAEVLSVVAGIFVLGYTLFLGNRESRRWDEVQRASYAFASVNGGVWGGFAAIALLMAPPVMNRLIDGVNAVVNAQGLRSPAMTNHIAVQLAFFGGIVLAGVMQTLGMVVASVIWRRRMGGFGEQA